MQLFTHNSQGCSKRKTKIKQKFKSLGNHRSVFSFLFNLILSTFPILALRWPQNRKQKWDIENWRFRAIHGAIWTHVETKSETGEIKTGFSRVKFKMTQQISHSALVFFFLLSPLFHPFFSLPFPLPRCLLPSISGMLTGHQCQVGH